jgi:hypothetical protein
MLKQCYLMSVVVSKIQFYKLTTSLVSARAHALLGCLLRALARLRVRCADRSASIARCKPLLALAFSMRARLAPRAPCFLLRTRRTPRREERGEEGGAGAPPGKWIGRETMEIREGSCAAAREGTGGEKP